MATRSTRRYYAFVPDVGRLRVPDEMNEAEAIVWSAARGATNVVREDGPPSNPTALAFIWKAEDTANAFNLNAALWEVLTEHQVKVPNGDLRPLVADIQRVIGENQS